MQLSAFTASLGRFLAELQRRKVLRVAATYLVGAWVVLQVAVALQTAMSLSASFSAAILALLVIGFPAALVVSWFFEITPEGVKRTAPATGDAPLVKPQTTDLALAGGLTLVVIVALVQLFTSSPTAPSATAPATTAEATPAKPEPPTLGNKSIAVLPFANLSPDKENEYFADGLTEEILNLLASIPDLKVISRTSSFAYKGTNTPLPEIAKRLGVRHIIEGSVRAQGEELRVTAQLIDVVTDTHLWSETFDRKIENIFALQDEIARAIASAFELEASFAKAAPGAPASRLKAYRLYLEGFSRFRERGASLPKAMTFFEDAIALDPEFAEAHAALAATYWARVSGGEREFADERAEEARHAAERAMALKPSLGLSFAVLGILDRNEFNWESSFANARKSLVLAPSDSNARLWFGTATVIMGYLKEGENSIETAVRLDPLSDLPPLWMMGIHVARGNNAEARALGERLAHSPRWYGASAHYALAVLAHDRGDAADAELHYKASLPQSDLANTTVAAVLKALRQPGTSLEAIKAAKAEAAADRNYNPIGVYALFRADDLLLDQLAKLTASGNARRVEPAIFLWLWAPRFKKMRSTPAFKELVKQWGYVDYWKKHGWPDRCRAKGEDDFECS
jgi:TolB-like protein/Tfp pilus assembly protein PilF